MSPLLDIVSVQARLDNTLFLQFENGETRIFDMKPLFERKPFTVLKNSPLFFQVRIDYGTVVWPGEIDIAPETLYEQSLPASGHS
jgi:hypothetical protein